MKQYKMSMLVIAIALTMIFTGCQKPSVKFSNSQFYDANGQFNESAAKDAYIAMMKYHGYPVFDGMKEKLWVSDYGTGQFSKLGLGAVMFANYQKERYMVMDLFLLPSQMLPEHYHLATDKGQAKMEGWLVRHGLSHIVGEGTPNLSQDIIVPKCHINGTVTVEHEVVCMPGQFVPLNRPTARHWQFAGPKGAIITEVATYHDDAGVRHSETKLKFP
ncbi:MAG: hypothetical protein JEZ07_15705 [Phycisphaerae bacterium]|nr:hypothetical protein [Phycisphaerae bacterium]